MITNLIYSPSSPPSARTIKEAVSKNCITKLNKIIGSTNLNKVSQDILKLSKNNLLSQYNKEFTNKHNNVLFRKKYEEFKNSISQIQELIKTPPKDLNQWSKYRKNIQQLVCAALTHRIYQELKYWEFNPVVHFLHTASDIIHNHSEGMSAFEKFGTHLLTENLLEKSYDYKKLETTLDQARIKSSTGSIDTLMKRIFSHAIFHPYRTQASWQSPQAFSVVTYNAYDVGNYNAELGTYFVGKVGFQSSAGPNPSHDDYRIFSAINQRNENLAQLSGNKRPASHTQVILEGGESHAGPKARRNAISSKGKGFSTFSAIALPLDGNAWKGKGTFKDIRTTQDFDHCLRDQMDEFGYREERPILKNQELDTGFFIPNAAFSDEKLAQVHDIFVKAFQHFEGTSCWQALSKQNDLAKTLLLGFNTILCLQYLIDVAEKHKKLPVLIIDGLEIRPTFNLACKQGIDRGVILNMMLRMFVDAAAAKDFKVTASQIKQYNGYTTGRAASVEARKIQQDRYDALKNFISLVNSASQEQRQAFLHALHLPADMRFVPSHNVIS